MHYLLMQQNHVSDVMSQAWFYVTTSISPLE